jgi:hypothetical protein
MYISTGCFLKDVSFFEKYNIFNYSVPKVEIEGFAVSFHDPFEIVSKGATTFNTNSKEQLRFSITPKVDKIDDSIMNADLNV